MIWLQNYKEIVLFPNFFLKIFDFTVVLRILRFLPEENLCKEIKKRTEKKQKEFRNFNFESMTLSSLTNPRFFKKMEK